MILPFIVGVGSLGGAPTEPDTDALRWVVHGRPHYRAPGSPVGYVVEPGRVHYRALPEDGER
jgi:hypothetical protein